MTVSEIIQLPADPTTGSSRSRPLGGNGWVSPFAQFIVDAELASDASGGLNRITIDLDPAYLNLVSMVTVNVRAAAAAVNYKMQLTAGNGAGEVLYVAGDTSYPSALATAGVNNVASAVWILPPILCTQNSAKGDASLIVQIPNTDGEDLIVRAWIYQWTKNAQEVTPLETLLAAVPSAGSVF